MTSTDWKMARGGFARIACLLKPVPTRDLFLGHPCPQHADEGQEDGLEEAKRSPRTYVRSFLRRREGAPSIGCPPFRISLDSCSLDPDDRKDTGGGFCSHSLSRAAQLQLLLKPAPMRDLFRDHPR